MKLYGTNIIPKGKAATFRFKPFKSNKPKEIIRYINTHAILACAVRDGHRKKDNITEIFNVLRIDVDAKGEVKKIDKALEREGLMYYKKPSTSNDGHKNKYKWHYIIPIKNISQNRDKYKKQYEYLIKTILNVELQDNSMNQPERNMNPRGEDGIDRTVFVKGKVWEAPDIPDEPKIHTKKATNKAKKSDVSKKTVWQKLKTITKQVERKNDGSRVHGSTGIGYKEFTKIGMALYDWCPKRGLKLWKKWAEQTNQYYVDQIDHKWEDFENGNLLGTVTIGSLFTMGKDGQHVERVEDEFKPIKKKKKKKEIVSLVIKQHLTRDMIKARGDQRVLFEGVLVHRMHTFLYGAAGSNKTTVASWIAGEVLKNNDDMLVHFWSFDAAANHENAIFDYIESKGIADNRFQILSSLTAVDMREYYKNIIENEIDLSSLIIIIDTFKFISGDVNNKKANTDALHFIKKLQSLGATVMTLGHTNKDGLKQSGTAEVEQDTDAILRIDREIDQFSKKITLSITASGRARFDTGEGVTITSSPNGTGYDYLKTAMDTMKLSETFKDIAAEVEKKKEIEEELKKKQLKALDQEIKDREDIKTIIMVIEDLIKDSIPTLPVITSDLSRVHGWSRDRVVRVLDTYSNVYWNWDVYKEKGRKATKIYHVKDGYLKRLNNLK